MPAFLLKNPTATALGVLLAIVLLACGVQTVRLSWAQADVAKADKAFADFKEKLAAESVKVANDAAAKSEKQFNALTAAIGTIGQLGAQTKTEIHYVQSNGGPCVADPKWRAIVGGVSNILAGSGSGGNQGKAGGGTPAALPGAAATRPK